MATHHHKAVYDAFTVPGGSKGYDFAAIRSNSSKPDAGNTQAPPPTTTIPFQQNFTDPERSVGPSNLPTVPLAPLVTKPAPRQNIEHDPSALIFSPPNSIASDFQRPVTQPDPNNYRPPVKAAGDVSLTGPQLVAFLTKATVRLPQGPTCQGIQLRFSQLYDLVRAKRVTEGCLKKLNFVVDAIDRELYDDAWTFYDQLQANFNEELASWGQGVKLLIIELVRLQKKSEKAGASSVSRVPNAQAQTETQRAVSAGFSKFM
uniref:Gag-pol polyprotein n=1 Tax=Steinernema glaseri TaxID=37863 RepID=A0A1I7ZQR0_9BILA